MSSTFQVTVRTIDRIWPHPAADRIQLASVAGLGYQFCVQKDLYTVGQKVIYFPVDSVLPQWIIDKLDMWGKDENGQVIRGPDGRVAKTMLVGDGQNRIHTVQLRGEIGQGFVCPAEELRYVACVRDIHPDGFPLEDGVDVTFALGVTKYDAPESVLKGAKLHPLPDGVSTYDIEGADNFLAVIAKLMDIPVCITEKLEGGNHATVKLPDDRVTVCARGNEIEELPDERINHWDAFRNQRLADLVQTIPVPDFPKMPVALRGELIGPGVPRNFYPLKVPEVRFFDIKVGPNYLDVEDWIRLIPENMRVPIIAKDVTLREWLAGRTLKEASNGKSLLAPDRLREGIVIRPMVEQKTEWDNGHVKRLILKQRSPQYLAKEKV